MKEGYKRRHLIGDIAIHTAELIFAVLSLSNPFMLIGLVIFMIVEVAQNKSNLSKILK